MLKKTDLVAGHECRRGSKHQYKKDSTHCLRYDYQNSKLFDRIELKKEYAVSSWTTQLNLILKSTDIIN